MEIKKEQLDAFFQWLKDDGLLPRKSERLWKKTIFSKLLNEDRMTIDNYGDFLSDYQKKNLLMEEKILPNMNSKMMIGISLKFDDKIKCIKNAEDAGSYIHLFFEDGSAELVPKIDCQKIIESLP